MTAETIQLPTVDLDNLRPIDRLTGRIYTAAHIGHPDTVAFKADAAEVAEFKRTHAHEYCACGVRHTACESILGEGLWEVDGLLYNADGLEVCVQCWRLRGTPECCDHSRDVVASYRAQIAYLNARQAEAQIREREALLTKLTAFEVASRALVLTGGA